LSGLVSPDDPKFVGTVKAVEEALLDEGSVYRYRYDDGLPGIEGAFNICTTWLIESYALLGRKKDAESLLEKYAALAGPTGFFAEEYEPETKMALGNFPQAYSHIGLIRSAVRLSRGI
jgi:trehalose 6-phosphate phosphatase